MSKAFDKINHNILVKKLVEETQLPTLIIKYMNENQNVWITFNKVMGDKWNTSRWNFIWAYFQFLHKGHFKNNIRIDRWMLHRSI